MKITYNMRAFLKSIIPWSLIVFVMVCPAVSAQTSFKLSKKDGHYFTTTSVNGVPDTKVVLVSCSPGVLVDSDTFGRLFDESHLEVVESDRAQIKSDTENYAVEKVYNGKMSIGGLSYSGDIYIVSGQDEVCVPVHSLRNEADVSANLMRFNFKKKTFDFIKREDVAMDNMHRYKIEDYTPAPLFNTTIELADTYGHEASTKGNMVFDLGNGTPVFFYRKAIAPFMNENGFKILPARNRAGEIVALGIYAGFCKIGDRTLRDISIGITIRAWIRDALGCVGPSAFKGYVIIDPENDEILYE